MDPWRRSRLIGLAVALLVLVPGILEVGSRLVDQAQGSPWDAEKSRAKVARLLQVLEEPWKGPGGSSDAPEGTILHPFTGWQTAEIQERVAGDREASLPYDVFLLGGSGAVALAGPLGRDPRLAGREVRVHAYGIEGFKQPQPELLLSYLLSLGHQPDAVIEVDGFDEAGIGWSNALAGTSPLYPSAEVWGKLTEGLRFDWELVDLLHDLDEARSGARKGCGHHLSMQLWRSAFLDRLGWLALDHRLAKIEAAESAIRAYAATRGPEAELAGPRTSTGPADVVSTIVSSWEEASIDMHALCERRGIAYLQILEPAGPGAGAGVERVHPGLREAGRRLAEHGIAFLDGAAVLDDLPEGLFDDSGRLGDRGLEILAESAARALPVR